MIANFLKLNYEQDFLALPVLIQGSKLKQEAISQIMRPRWMQKLGRTTLCHLQLKCELPLDRGCSFEVAGWV